MSEEYDSNYLDWKGWNEGSFGALPLSQAAYFEEEFKGLNLPVGNVAVLEVGFGNGEFLSWAARNEWSITGVEASPELVSYARSVGFPSFSPNEWVKIEPASVDLVVALDVLEHLEFLQIDQLLKEVKRVLRPGGHLLARFPNGDSISGLVHQNGDFTHKTAIGSGKVAYLESRHQLERVALRAPRQSKLRVSLSRSIYRLIAGLSRNFLRLALQYLFFGSHRIDLVSDNLIWIARKPARL